MSSVNSRESVSAPATSKAQLPTTKTTTPATAKAPVKRVAVPVRKPVAQTTAKPVVKTALAASAKPASDKLLKPKKIKLVRDSFTIPKLEYLMLEALKLRAGTLGKSVKKNELIRAGIKALAAMPDSQFLAAFMALAPVKTGHPAKD